MRNKYPARAPTKTKNYSKYLKPDFFCLQQCADEIYIWKSIRIRKFLFLVCCLLRVIEGGLIYNKITISIQRKIKMCL